MRRVLAGFAIVALTTWVAGCGDDDDPSGPLPEDPDFTMTVSPATLEIEAGDPQGTGPAAAPMRGTGDIQVTVTRSGGFDGSVAVTVENLPSGVTASALTIAGGETSGTVTIDASSSAAAGTTALTVRGSATGLTDETGTVSLVVSEPEPPPASETFALTLSSATVSVAQGASAPLTVEIDRTGGFTGEVTLAAASDPAGLDLSFDPVGTTGNTSTLTIAAPASLAPGDYTVTVTGSGTDAPDATAEATATVTQAASGTDIQISFCEAGDVPTWFAFQDGAGAWTRVAEDPPLEFHFTLTEATAGLAFTNANGTAGTTIWYGSRENFEAFSGDFCEGDPPVKTVNGSFAGVGATETATVSLGGDFASVFGAAGNLNFQLTRVQTGMTDLIASRAALGQDGQGNPTSTLNSLIIRRDLDPADGSTLPVLDFGSGEAFGPVSRTLTVNNAGSDPVIATQSYTTANGTTGTFFTSLGTADQYAGVPTSQQADGDLHGLTVTAGDFQATDGVFRTLSSWFKEAVDKTVDLGPELSTPTVTAPVTTPNVLPRVELTTQAEYGSGWFVSYNQGGGNSVLLLVFQGFGVGATLDLTLPDFGGTDGWNPNWGLQPGTAVEWSVSASGWSASGLPGIPPTLEGSVNRSSFRTGTLNP